MLNDNCVYLCDDKYFTFRPLLPKKNEANLFFIQTLQIHCSSPTFSPPQAIAGILLFQGVYLWLFPITSNIDNNENTWHLFSVEMWKLQSNIYRTHFPNHCSQIWLSNSKTWHSKSVTSCSRAVSGPILYIFKFMSMPLEKHHLPSWSNKCSLLSLPCNTIWFPDSNPSQSPLPHILESAGDMGNISILEVDELGHIHELINLLVKMLWHK